MERTKKVPARFYQSANGTEPVRDWLLRLSKDDRKAVGKDIATVEYGWPVGMPTCAPLGAGLYEGVRISKATGSLGFCSVSAAAASCFCTGSSRKRTRCPTPIWTSRSNDNGKWNDER